MRVILKETDRREQWVDDGKGHSNWCWAIAATPVYSAYDFAMQTEDGTIQTYTKSDYTQEFKQAFINS